MKMRQKKRKGGVLVMFAISMVVIIACSGLAVDIGRMYVNRTEAQSFVDSLALSKAAEMIGARVPNSSDVWKRYDFDNQSFDSAAVTVDYSSSSGFGSGTVTSTPTSGSLFVRARASVSVPLLLLPVLLTESTGSVSATAVVGVEQVTSMGEGSFPYVVRQTNGGFDPSKIGIPYTFRWGNNVVKDLDDAWKYVVSEMAAEASLDAKLTATATVLGGGKPAGFVKNPPNVNPWCAGDATLQFLQTLYALDPFDDGVSADLFAWTGSFYQGGTNDIVAAMAYGYQDQVLTVGDAVAVATGVRQATVNELEWVIAQDTNQSDNDPSTYYSNVHNGMRVIQVPTVSADTAFLKPGSGATATILSFETFLLLVPSSQYGNPMSNWCAVYAGASEQGTEDPVDQTSGIWVLRLIA